MTRRPAAKFSRAMPLRERLCEHLRIPFHMAIMRICRQRVFPPLPEQLAIARAKGPHQVVAYDLHKAAPARYLATRRRRLPRHGTSMEANLNRALSRLKQGFDSPRERQ